MGFANCVTSVLILKENPGYESHRDHLFCLRRKPVMQCAYLLG